MQISAAQHSDVAAWLRLAEEVVPLFGPMPGFDAVLAREIAQKQAYCARIGIGNAAFTGCVLISNNGLQIAIRWLAVSSEFRRRGIGKMLVEAVLSSVLSESIIHVDTFVAGSSGSEADRRLYESCGFSPSEILGEADMIRQRYARKL
ncbi:GNAT family N-acetyltransferase [Aureimonas sp. N4]|uniref:GNAT family N-acetyltransferase n=1 Tax=Aureimonas sp. N4 TaxID=1638165 RepID=UPI0009E8C66C|nr:GNAT family N-acetyltransferase [Aureimonas sp. N4]